MRYGFSRLLGTLAVVGCAGLPGLAAGQKTKHPHYHLHHALWELRDARKELKEAPHNFGGHRKKAIEAINAAAKNLDLALKNAGDNIKGTPTRGDLREVYKKYAQHPHLHHALHELKHAHHQLKEAKHNFGGHRKAAVHDINIAIHQIELCLKHARKS
jgi:hypothetical protein